MYKVTLEYDDGSKTIWDVEEYNDESVATSTKTFMTLRDLFNNNGRVEHAEKVLAEENVVDGSNEILLDIGRVLERIAEKSPDNYRFRVGKYIWNK